MSSILRALKKLENEPRHQNTPRSLDSTFVPLADTGTQRPTASVFMMVIAGGIICGLVILGGWWIFSENGQPPSVVTQKISPSDSKLDISPVLSQDLNIKPVSSVSEQPEKSSSEILSGLETAKLVAEKEPVNIEKPIFQPIIPEDTSPTEKTTQAKTDLVQPRNISNLIPEAQTTRPDEKPVIASVNTPAPPAKTAEVEIPKLNDPDMKLQAITWSRTPQKRIAVINNRILREGEIVSGYFINTINQDDVVLSQEGKKWKIFFR